MANKQESSTNMEKNQFRDAVTITITLIFPLIITTIALFASYWLPVNSALFASQNCTRTVGVTNQTQYNGCVSSQVLHYNNKQYQMLAKYLNQSFILLFIIVIFFLAYLLLSKGYVKYITEIIVASAIVWELIFIIRIAMVYGAFYSNPSFVSGIPMVIILFVFNATNSILVSNFVLWYFYLFVIIFFELMAHPIKHLVSDISARGNFRSKRKKQR